jgi:hypothetical protein
MAIEINSTEFEALSQQGYNFASIELDKIIFHKKYPTFNGNNWISKNSKTKTLTQPNKHRGAKLVYKLDQLNIIKKKVSPEEQEPPKINPVEREKFEKGESIKNPRKIEEGALTIRGHRDDKRKKKEVIE